MTDSSLISRSPSLSSSRRIVKFYGKNNNKFLSIDQNQSSISISKTTIDTFKKQGQTSTWKYEVDQVFDESLDFDCVEADIEGYEDFFSDFGKEGLFRTICLVGDRNLTLSNEPLSDIIINLASNCLRNFDKNPKLHEKFLIAVSFVELSSIYAVDYLTNGDEMSAFKPKIEYNNNDISIKGISQVVIKNTDNLKDLIRLSNEYINAKKFGFDGEFCPKDKSMSQIFTLKLIKQNTNECASKINFVLYKAFEIEENDQNEQGSYQIYNDDNYNFFQAVQGKENYRVSYTLKYIKDTFFNGTKFFVFILPCEYQYINLLDNMLNYITQRDHNVDLFKLIEDDSEEEASEIKRRNGLNFDRLRKIENKKQVMNFLNFMDKYIVNN